MRITRSAFNIDPRHAGDLRRYHTHPTLQQSTVASHTWHAMRIWLELFGPMSPDVSTCLLLHDAGEAGAGPGDVPFGSKRASPSLAAEVGRLEEEQIIRLHGPLYRLCWDRLPPVDRGRIKVCDLLEMCEFGLKDWLLGNQYARLVVRDTRDAALEVVSGRDTEAYRLIVGWLARLFDRYEITGDELSWLRM